MIGDALRFMHAEDELLNVLRSDNRKWFSTKELHNQLLEKEHKVSIGWVRYHIANFSKEGWILRKQIHSHYYLYKIKPGGMS